MNQVLADHVVPVRLAALVPNMPNAWKEDARARGGERERER